MTRRPVRPSGGGLVVAVASLAGAAAFLFPFLLPALAQVGAGEARARAVEAPIVLTAVTGCCLAAMLIEFGANREGTTSRTVALLGALVAIDALLRLVPSVSGASPIFGLIVLAGAALGPTPGFLMGSLTLLVSAMATGGLGPWLPYQMLAAGWVGLSAGWLPRPASMPLRIALLAAFGAAWGLLFGALLNLYSWPFVAPGAGTEASIYWSPGLSLGETLERYRAFYLLTSLPHDAFRAGANALFVLVLGAPILRLLERAARRSAWTPM